MPAPSPRVIHLRRYALSLRSSMTLGSIGSAVKFDWNPLKQKLEEARAYPWLYMTGGISSPKEKSAFFPFTGKGLCTRMIVGTSAHIIRLARPQMRRRIVKPLKHLAVGLKSSLSSS